MVAQRTGGFEDGFLELVEEQLKRCRQELADIDLDITQLQGQRADAAQRVAQLEDLLRGSRHPEEGEDAEPSPVPTPEPRGPIADAGAVVSLIRESGRSMHYLDIHRTLVDRGYQIGGEGNAATLLARYSKDPRLNRIARGTYDIVDRHPDPSKDLGWNDKGETTQHPVEDDRQSLPQTRASRPLPSGNIVGNDTFDLSFVGLKATAIYLGDGRVKVLRGSQARKSETALGNGGAKALEYRRRLSRDGAFEDKGPHFELTRDIDFDNPSLAAMVMSGASKNGWVEWKTGERQTLQDVTGRVPERRTRSSSSHGSYSPSPSFKDRRPTLK